MADAPNTENYTLGRGRVLFNKKESDGSYKGYRDLGNAPAFNFSIDIATLEHYSSRAGLRAKDKKVVSEVTPKFTFTLDEINAENVAMLYFGDVTDVSQTLDTGVLDMFENVYGNRYFDLSNRNVTGVTYLRYDGGTGAFTAGLVVSGATGSGTIEAIVGDTTAGVLVLSGLTPGFIDDEAITDTSTGSAQANGTEVVSTTDILVCDTTGTTIYTASTDYTINLVTGRVYFMSTMTITEGDDIYVAYDCGAFSYKMISALSETELEGRLNFIGDNPIGINQELEAWIVSLIPSGETAYIGDDWATIGFEGEVLKDETNHPANPYFIIKM